MASRPICLRGAGAVSDRLVVQANQWQTHEWLVGRLDEKPPQGLQRGIWDGSKDQSCCKTGKS